MKENDENHGAVSTYLTAASKQAGGVAMTLAEKAKW